MSLTYSVKPKLPVFDAKRERWKPYKTKIFAYFMTDPYCYQLITDEAKMSAEAKYMPQEIMDVKRGMSAGDRRHKSLQTNLSWQIARYTAPYLQRSLMTA